MAIKYLQILPNVPWGTKLPHLRTTSPNELNFLIFILKNTFLMVDIALQVNCFTDMLGVQAGRNSWKSCGPNHTRRWENMGYRGPLKQLWSEERQKPMIPSSRSGIPGGPKKPTQFHRYITSLSIFKGHTLIWWSSAHQCVVSWAVLWCCI